MMKHEHMSIHEITQWLKYNIFMNNHIMWGDYPDVQVNGQYYDLVDIIASLHNMLCEAITGEPYDYMWHWANKIGSWTEDNAFDLDKEGKNNAPNA